jgi:lysophospholipid acyltransferase (LPLAT)-like uncharacterized protein
MSYEVDNMPWPLRPPYLFFTSLLGLSYYLYFQICRLTCQIEAKGFDQLDENENYIFCMWHSDWWPYFVVFLRERRPHIWINHPAAYMRPIHVTIRLAGVEKLILGSSGERGRQAADRLANCLKNGYSTAISPDGPAGPPKVLKKGVLHIALRSGVPIIPLSVRSTRSFPIPSWDSKRIPLPFSKIRVVVHDAVAVTEENFDLATKQLSDELRQGTT